MRNVSGKSCRENQNTQFVFNNVLSKSVLFMRKHGKNYYGTGQATDYNMVVRVACRILKFTSSRSEFVVLADFPLQ
jgi:hypothetical protein